MSALLTDLINFTILADVIKQYADGIMHECKVQQRHNLYNKTRSIKDKCEWYITDLKLSLSPEEAQSLAMEMKNTDGLGAFTILEWALHLDEEKRNEIIRIVKAIRNNNHVSITIHE